VKKIFLLVKPFLISILVGLVIGLIIGAYQFIMKYVTNLSLYLYSNKTLINFIILIICLFIFSIANYFIIKLCPQIDGSGIPSLELGIRKYCKINYKFDVFGMIINSYISSFIGLPLGSEGPSVVIAGKLSKLVCDITKNKDDDLIPLASGIGFGCAFLSPLSGLVYAFEEMFHSFKFINLIKGILIILSAFCIEILINKHFLLSLNNFVEIDFKTSYILILIMIFDLVIGYLFVKILITLKEFLIKNNKNILIKFRSFPLLIITFILNIYFYMYLGSGGLLMKENVINFNLSFIIFILISRFLLTIISGTGSVTGGLVVPIMSIGYLIGQIICLISKNTLSLPIAYFQYYSLISAIMLFGIITKTPLTSSSLIFTTILRSSNFNLILSLKYSLLPIIIVFIAIYLSKFTKLDCLYEEQMNLTLKYRKS